MQVCIGESILGKIAIGPLRIYRKAEYQACADSRLTPAEEWERFEAARQEAKKQLESLYDKALEEIGEENAAIFKIHQGMLEDEDFLNAVKNLIEKQGTAAAYAVQEIGNNFASTFAAMDNGYMQARAADVKDISRRMLQILLGNREETVLEDGPAILVADDLTPSETLQMDKTKILGFIIRYGSSSSHAAILARTLNIPALIGVDFDESWDGRQGVLDGHNHCLYIDPEQDLLTAMERKRTEEMKQQALLQGLKGKPNRTLDGQEIQVSADIGHVGDVGLVLLNDAQGIGLFRSEFIYWEAEDFPTEDQQFVFYKRVVETMAGKRVVIRTLDMRTDEQAPYFNPEKETNPALGCRGIRTSLTRKDVFKQQLRAILRASAFGKAAVLFPMVTSVREVRDAKDILEECRVELLKQDVAVGKVETGIVIGTPAAVMVADELAEEADFFSLNTDDLTQYALALDQQNLKMGMFYDLHHPAILRMVRQTVEAARRHGRRVGLCGELASDPALTGAFLRMGLDELSVPPASVLPLRKQIRNLNLSRNEDQEKENLSSLRKLA